MLNSKHFNFILEILNSLFLNKKKFKYHLNMP